MKIEALSHLSPPPQQKYRVRIKKALNGQLHWRVKSANNKIVAVGGETFTRYAGAAKSFTTFAEGIRAMSPEAFSEFMSGLADG